MINVETTSKVSKMPTSFYQLCNWRFSTDSLLLIIVVLTSASSSWQQQFFKPSAVLPDKKFSNDLMLQPRNKPTSTPEAYMDENLGIHEFETLLFNQLFEESGYSSRARPVKNRVPVNVTLEMVLLKINEILEIDQEISISGFLKINWTDFRLAWDPDNYGGIERIFTDIGNIWLPDLALINSDDVYATTRDGRFPVTLTASGSMLYVPAGKINSRCELNLSFESWVYSDKAVNVSGVNFTIDESHFIENPQWALLDAFTRTTVADYDNANYSRVEFFIILHRKSLFFLTYTVLPCGLISYLQMFSHILPLSESERINFGTTTLVAFAVFHISVVEQVPKSSESVPLLAIYVDSLMCLIGMSLIETFFMMNWLSRVAYTVPPPFLWFNVVERLQRIAFLGQIGLFWRRNYLRILARVHFRQLELGLHMPHSHGAHKKGGEDLQMNMTRKAHARRLSVSFKGHQERNIDALVKLMERYGNMIDAPSWGGVNDTNSVILEDDASTAANDVEGPKRLSVDEFMATSQQIASAVASVTSPRNSSHSQAYSDQTLPVPGDTMSPVQGLASSSIVTVEQAGTDVNKCHKGSSHLLGFTGSLFDKPVDLTSREMSPSAPGNLQPTAFTIGTNFRKPSVQFKSSVGSRFLDSQHGELRKIESAVLEMKTTLGKHSLKRECLGVWTVFITAIDRMISFTLFVLCTTIPICLFIFYPEKLSVEEFKYHLK